MKNKVIAVDMDGCLCEEKKTFEKSLAEPKQDIINIINLLYNSNTIVIYTARSWLEYKMTEDWLKKNNVKYNFLVCGKYPYDVLIDDRVLNVEDVDKIMELK